MGDVNDTVSVAGILADASSRKPTAPVVVFIVYDVPNRRELRGTRECPLEIPEHAVVVPGTRPAGDEWAASRQLQVACALIVKYRDERTDRATALEQALR